jgi:hypothetical protein
MLGKVVAEESRTVCNLEHLQTLFVNVGDGESAVVYPIKYAELEIRWRASATIPGARHGSPPCIPTAIARVH